MMDTGSEKSLLCAHSLNSGRQNVIYHPGNPDIAPTSSTRKQADTRLLKLCPRGWGLVYFLHFLSHCESHKASHYTAECR